MSYTRTTLSRYALFSSCLIGIIGVVLYWWRQESLPIYPYEKDRDRTDLIEIYKKNVFWLTNDPDEEHALQSFMHSLDTKSSSESWLDRNNLSLYVYRDADKSVGFVAYHKTSASTARILYIAVDDAYRRRGFAEKLLQYALNDLKNRGFRQIELLTRLKNKNAQGLYKKFGFRQSWDDGTLVSFIKIFA